MSEWTNDLLFELCKAHVGCPWWVPGLAYSPNEIDQTGDEPSFWTLDIGGVDVRDEADGWKGDEQPTEEVASILPATAAADLILGSAVRWLATCSDSVELHSGAYHRAGSETRGGPFESDGHDSLLAAVLGLCNEVNNP